MLAEWRKVFMKLNPIVKLRAFQGRELHSYNLERSISYFKIIVKLIEKIIWEWGNYFGKLSLPQVLVSLLHSF